MGTAVRTVAALAGALLSIGLAGCAAAASAPGGSPPASPGRSASSAPTLDHPGLRGVAATRVSCSPQTQQPPGAAPLLPKAPVRLFVCPLLVPSASNRTVTLAPVPADLIAALARPDSPRPTGAGYVCAAYADVPRVVFAQTADGSLYRLHIPVDGACGHYLLGAVRLLGRYAPMLVRPLG